MVSVAETGGKQSLFVKANVPWTILTTEVTPRGAQLVQTFSGGHTTDAGTVLHPAATVEGFTVLASP